MRTDEAKGNHMKRCVAALSAFALLAAACSAQTSKEGQPASSTGTTSRTASKPTGHVGDTLNLTRVDGGKIDVTLTQVINPATVEGSKAEPDKTYVATNLTIADTGTTAIEGDANVNVSLAGSDNRSYAADLNDVSECTNFDSGAFHLGPGESATGCVVFALPPGVSPTKVKYVPSAGFADDSGEWLVVP
jgi:hypothetical protein